MPLQDWMSVTTFEKIIFNIRVRFLSITFGYENLIRSQFKEDPFMLCCNLNLLTYRKKENYCAPWENSYWNPKEICRFERIVNFLSNQFSNNSNHNAMIRLIFNYFHDLTKKCSFWSIRSQPRIWWWQFYRHDVIGTIWWTQKTYKRHSAVCLVFRRGTSTNLIWTLKIFVVMHEIMVLHLSIVCSIRNNGTCILKTMCLHPRPYGTFMKMWLAYIRGICLVQVDFDSQGQSYTDIWSLLPDYDVEGSAPMVQMKKFQSDSFGEHSITWQSRRANWRANVVFFFSINVPSKFLCPALW